MDRRLAAARLVTGQLRAPKANCGELTCYRGTIVAERVRLVNRLQKVLEDTNLKLTSVMTLQQAEVLKMSPLGPLFFRRIS